MKENSWVFWSVFGILFAWFGWLDESELRFRMQYRDEISLDVKPHDCDFFGAPLGNKYCYYEPHARIVMYSTDNGKPIISYDEGKTWAWNPGGPTETRKITFIDWIRQDK
jgi:hypothetical protein